MRWILVVSDLMYKATSLEQWHYTWATIINVDSLSYKVVIDWVTQVRSNGAFTTWMRGIPLFTKDKLLSACFRGQRVLYYNLLCMYMEFLNWCVWIEIWWMDIWDEIRDGNASWAASQRICELILLARLTKVLIRRYSF